MVDLSRGEFLKFGGASGIIFLANFPQEQRRDITQVRDIIDRVLVAGVYAPDAQKRIADFVCTPDNHDEVVINEAINFAVASGFGIVELLGSGSLNGRPDFIVSQSSGQDYAIKYPRKYIGGGSGYKDTNPLWLRGQGKTFIQAVANQPCHIIRVGDEPNGVDPANEYALLSDFLVDANNSEGDAIYIARDMNYGTLERIEAINAQGNGFNSVFNRYWKFLKCGTHGNGKSGFVFMGGYQNIIKDHYSFSNGHYGGQLTSYNGSGCHRTIVSGCHFISNGKNLALSGIGILGDDNIINDVQCFDEAPEGSKSQAFGLEIALQSNRTIIGTRMCLGNKYGEIADSSPNTIYSY